MNKAIFIDRDGVINVFKHFIKNPDEVELEINAAKAIKLINKNKYLAIVISNQPVIAAGQATFNDVDAIHLRLSELLKREGAFLNDFFFCPHFPERGYEGEIEELKIVCSCRKPSIGLIEKACEKYDINLKESWMIGDMTSDIQTGINAGCKTALVRTGRGGADCKYIVKPDITAFDLLDAVKIILGKSE